MNSSHLAAILRMRWQLMRNQLRKSGQLNFVITMIVLAAAALASLSSFVIAAGWGSFFLGMLEPDQVIYVWDGLAAVFLFTWVMGLMVELQRSEMLSLRNLLHLPISLSGAFFLNYASSLASLTVLLFLPAMLGLCVASVVHFGIASAVTFVLLIAFLFMVTAVSYQFRGWLARLMENKRRRGTVIMITTLLFVMIVQIPNMINMGTMRSRMAGTRSLTDAHLERMAELQERREAGELDPSEYVEAARQAQQEYEQQRESGKTARAETINRTVAFVNAVLPVGWLPYGASAAASGALLSPWLCVLGMSTIGLGSLALAYRSTLRSYTGDHNKGYRRVARKARKAGVQSSFLERSVPLLTDTQSVVALATLRSMLRAPEAKMALLTPFIFACIFGSMMFTGSFDEFPDVARPWIGLAALGISLFGMVQMMVNVFGLDRQGFRAYVLMPVPRRDILLGKNLGVLPIIAILSAALIVVAGFVARMQLSHIVATLLQIVVALCLYFPVGNNCSIIAPIGMAVGTMRPVSMKFSVLVMQMVSMMFAPLAVLPAAAALGADSIINWFIDSHGIPIYLVLTLIELPCAIWFYHRMLHLQGRHLQQREQAILEVISKVAD